MIMGYLHVHMYRLVQGTERGFEGGIDGEERPEYHGQTLIPSIRAFVCPGIILFLDTWYRSTVVTITTFVSFGIAM